MKTIEEIAIEHGLCTCGEEYKSRNLTAPDCPFHAFALPEAMEAYAEQFKPKWVDVRDRLPNFSTSVLVWCRIYGRYIATYEPIGEFGGVKYGNWHDGKSLGVLPPLFWQPLPDHPIIIP